MDAKSLSEKLGCDLYVERKKGLKHILAGFEGRALIPVVFVAGYWKDLLPYCKSVKFLQHTLKTPTGKNDPLPYAVIEMTKEKNARSLVLEPILSDGYSPDAAYRRQVTINKALGLHFNKNACFQSTTGIQEVVTPREIYSPLNSAYAFDFDPCPIEPTFDGLTCEWGMSNFVNPPFRCYLLWVRKALNECENGRSSLLLIPSNTKSVALCELAMSRFTEYFCFLFNRKWGEKKYCDVCLVRLSATNHQSPPLLFWSDFFSKEENHFRAYLRNALSR